MYTIYSTILLVTSPTFKQLIGSIMKSESGVKLSIISLVSSSQHIYIIDNRTTSKVY